MQHAPAAVPFLGAVAYGQILKPEIGAVAEIQDVCISGSGQNLGFLPDFSPDGEILHVVDHQLIAVKHRLPAVIGAFGGLAVVPGV